MRGILLRQWHFPQQAVLRAAVGVPPHSAVQMVHGIAVKAQGLAHELHVRSIGVGHGPRLAHDKAGPIGIEFVGDDGDRGAAGQFEPVGDPAPRAKDASVVVRNPTHVAVALRYEPDVLPLPYVICKGMGREAERIIEEAERNGVPTFEDVPLARGLNDACEVGDAVPTAYIEPVALVIRWLYINYPQRVFDGQDESVRQAAAQSRTAVPQSYREGSTYGNARTFGNREPT